MHNCDILDCVDKLKADKIIAALKKEYSGAKPALEFKSTYQLLIAVVLSAQCTDERVNKVTRELFKKADTPEKILQMTQSELEKEIFSCGFYRNKAANILSATRDIVDKFNGQVPKTVQELTSLAGVGQKTANVIYSVAFGGDAIAVDTHVFRVSNRLGLADSNSVFKTEEQLKQIIDKDKWSVSHHYLIYHGRRVCHSRKPDCEKCFLNDLCEKNIKYHQKEDKNV